VAFIVLKERGMDASDLQHFRPESAANELDLDYLDEVCHRSPPE